MREKEPIGLILKRPVDDEVTKGGEWEAKRENGRLHKGLDFKTSWGNKVFASEKGEVVLSKWIEKVPGRNGSYGNTVVIDHTPGAGNNQRHIYTLYAHLNTRSVSVKDKVEKGTVIGKAGNSGTKAWYFWKKNGYYEKGKSRGVSPSLRGYRHKGLEGKHGLEQEYVTARAP